MAKGTHRDSYNTSVWSVTNYPVCLKRTFVDNLTAAFSVRNSVDRPMKGLDRFLIFVTCLDEPWVYKYPCYAIEWAQLVGCVPYATWEGQKPHNCCWSLEAQNTSTGSHDVQSSIKHLKFPKLLNTFIY